MPQDVPLTGDRELMEYAFYNLLTNAVKYSPARTQVTLEAVRKHEHAYISVEDQGIGMDQKEVKKHFPKVLSHQARRAIGRSGYRYRSFDRRADRHAAWRDH